MIRDVLIPRLRERFPERGLRVADPPDPVATFPAAHPAVGAVTIWDDGDELTVAIGDITHGHFSSYEEGLAAGQRAEQIVSDVIAFLEGLFADRVLLWKSPGGGGGWRILESAEGISSLDAGDLTFTWSGPVKSLRR
jgi:hypothetical protein